MFDREEVFFGVRNGVDGFPGLGSLRLGSFDFRVLSFELGVGVLRFLVCRRGVREAGGGFFFEIFFIELFGITVISRGGGGLGPLLAESVKEGFVGGSFEFRVSSFERMTGGLR